MMADEGQLSRLNELREELRKTDEMLIEQIARRMWLSREIGSAKQDNLISFYQPELFEKLKVFYRTEGIRSGLDEELMENIATLLHNESLRIQSNLNNSEHENS